MNWIYFIGIIGILFLGLLVISLLIIIYFFLKSKKINKNAPSKDKYSELKDPKNISERRFSIYLDNEKEVNKIGKEGFKSRESGESGESRESGGGGGHETAYSRELPSEDSTNNQRRTDVQKLHSNNNGESSRGNKKSKRKFRFIKRRRNE